MYFEDFKIMDSFETSSRKILAEDLERFTDVTGITNPLFRDDEAAKEAGHDGRILPGAMIFSINTGLCYQSGVFDHLVALAGVDRMKFLAPVHPGDILTAVVTVVEKRTSRKSDRGVVVIQHVLKKQEGDPAMSAIATYLIATRTDQPEET